MATSTKQIQWQDEGPTRHVVLRLDCNPETGEIALRSESDPSFQRQTYSKISDLFKDLEPMVEQGLSSSTS